MDTVEARIRALGQIRLSEEAHDATDALSVMFEDPEVRALVEPTRRRRFSALSRRHRVVIGSLVALAGVGVAVPAVVITSSLLARTGEFGDPSTSTEVDDTEWIALGAADAPQVVVDAYPDYLTLPLETPKEMAIADVSRIFARMSAEAGGQARAQEGLMTQTYETFAMCAWTEKWLTAHKSSAKADEALATSWLGNFDNFRTFVANDGGGVKDRLTVVAAAAVDGDVETMQDSSGELGCDSRLRGGNR